MKASVLQETFSSAVATVARIASTRSPLPVLTHILITADNDRLRLSATNLEMAITCWIGAKVEEPGATTVPASTLSDLVKTLPYDRIDLGLIPETKTLKLRCGTSKAELKGMDAEEFPPQPHIEGEYHINLPIAHLRVAISQVAVAASSDEARPVLTGVQLSAKGQEITLAAADGFRLAVRKMELAAPVEQPFTVVVPAAALREVERLFGKGDETISISATRSLIIFQARDIELAAQLLDMPFPDFNAILPKGHTTRTVLATGALLKACRQVEIFARSGNHSARLDIHPANGVPAAVELYGQSDETGFHQAVVDAASVEGEAITIAFNVRFLKEALEAVQAPNLALETQGSTAPGVIRPVGDDSYLHVIMPMHMG
jgi:DNA polymerase-3 subunit beta